MARAMKGSGIEWIGEIPVEWQVPRIKNIIQQTKNGIKIGPFGSALTNKTTEKGEYNVYSQANLIASDFSFTKNTIDAYTFEELKGYEVFPGDICLSMMGTIGKCKKVPVGIARGIMDSHLIKIRLSESVDSRFFEYVYDKDLGGVCFSQMQFDKKGFIMDGLNTSIVKNLFFPLPSKYEQVRIADFLDSECARIDAVIEQIRASIEEYKKLKQSVITQAVTKGIRPGRKMKDSGVEWIGEIPEEWTCEKLKYVTTISRGLFNHRPRSDERYYNGNYPFVQTGDVAQATKYITSYSQTLNELGKSVSKEFPKGTLTMTIAANVGDVAILGFDAYFPDSVVGFVPKEGITDLYLFYVLSAMKSEFVRTAIKSTQLNLNIERVKELFVPITTSLVEQQKIIDYLEKKCSEIDNLIICKKGIVSELEYYKKSLIFEYVTGKKEVM